MATTTETEAVAPRRRPGRLRAVVLARPTTCGLALALLFWWKSLSPTLMPRTWLVQAAISAICVAAGYAFGTIGSWIVRRIVRWRSITIAPETIRWFRLVLLVVAVATVLLGLLLWPRWQNDQRELVALDSISPALAIPMALVSVVLLAILVPIGRLIGAAVRTLDGWNRRHLPAAIASPVTVVVVVLLAVFVLRDVAFNRFTNWAGTTFGTFDEGTNEGTVQPTAPTVSGSPESLIPWDSLGLQGRDFVAGATRRGELAAFHGGEATVLDPIRIYAGVDSAGDPRDRADLAVADLERAGGFDREVLVVATSTGTGWIDPDAARALEQIHGGDTAIVSMQYSFLPSWISFITDLDLASEAGSQLFDAVHSRWSELPADDRPQLVVFGLSLGSFGAESAFAGRDMETSIANLVARTEGALLVGTPAASQVLQQLTSGRDAGSPAWAPIVDEGRTVRFETRDPDQPRPTGEWADPHVLYIAHPSDPVVYWDWDWLWSEPEWMDHPRGYDVPDRGGWFPFVTFTQGVFDLMAGFGAPPGFGHDYRLDYVQGWSAVAPPDGWTAEDAARLEAFLFPAS